jgi:hypothetical protein
MATKKRKTAAKVVRKSTKRNIEPVSFVISKEEGPFISWHITNQTIYWGVLAVYIIFLSIWIYNIQIDTMNIINTIRI